VIFHAIAGWIQLYKASRRENVVFHVGHLVLLMEVGYLNRGGARGSKLDDMIEQIKIGRGSVWRSLLGTRPLFGFSTMHI